jgi:imidazolonepropionase
MKFTNLDILIVNARLATMAGGGHDPVGRIEDSACGISEGKIAWLGAYADLPAGMADNAKRLVDAGGAWITPGLIDCHTHVIHGGGRAGEFNMRLNGARYEEIARAGGGIVSTVTATREADEDDLLVQAFARVDALTADGVTTLEIKSGYGLETETELRMLRAARRIGDFFPVDVRTTFLGAHAIPKEYTGNADGYIDLVCTEMLPQATREGLVDAVDAFCEGIAFSSDQVRRVFEVARDLGLPVKLHAEQLSDLKGAVLAAEFGALSVDHLEYVGQDGVDAMARAGSVAVILPGAYYYLNETQKPPIQAFRDAGVPMAVATDCNPGSSPLTSMLVAMNMACVLFRMTPDEVMLGATRYGAQALGLKDRGILATGMRADLACWVVDELVELPYVVGARPLRWSMLAGSMREEEWEDWDEWEE